MRAPVNASRPVKPCEPGNGRHKGVRYNVEGERIGTTERETDWL
jgi:hypothetical protein